MPVIVWRKSAMAEFVLKNKVGIIIDKLDDISYELQKITEEEYKEMQENSKVIAQELMQGKYLTQAIKELQNLNI